MRPEGERPDTLAAVPTAAPEPSAPAVRPRIAQLAWGLGALTLIAAAVWSLVFHLRLPPSLPTEADHRTLAAVIEKEARPGDVVVLFPWWTERARLYVPPGVPVVGHLRSAHDAYVRHPRIWVIGQPSLPRADEDAFMEAFGPGRTQIGEVRRFGPLTLTLYENGRHRPVVFDAAADLMQAHAYVEQPNGMRMDCARQKDRFACPGGGHLYVRAEWHEVLYEPRHCLYMHPPGGAGRVVLEWPQVPLTHGGVLEAGFIWDRHAFKAAHHTTAYVTVENAATGARLAEIGLPPGLGGVQRATLAPNAEVPLRVSVRSDNAADRWLCVDVLAFGAGAGDVGGGAR